MESGTYISWNPTLPATWQLPTGLWLAIENAWDWLVFGDVFISRDYSIEIGRVNLDRDLVILDLGANVGYFSLYMADQCRRAKQPYKIIGIEAELETWIVYRRRVAQDKNISSYLGAVGKRQGTAYIAPSQNHATSILIPETDECIKYPVSYVDLENIVTPSVDIIKCDIEGSEFDFVENYPDLLRKTQLVFMEIHHTMGNATTLRSKMKDYGFTKNIVTRSDPNTSIEVFSRV